MVRYIQREGYPRKEKAYLYCSQHYQFLRERRNTDRVCRALSMLGLVRQCYLAEADQRFESHLCDPSTLTMAVGV